MDPISTFYMFIQRDDIIMENRNNALHYKMYKSGKSIVYAGLATTAVLAGLTLANAN